MGVGTIFDYMDWRGDLTLTASPFNEVDSLLVNELAYAHVEDYVGHAERVSIREAASRYFSGKNSPDYVLGVETLRKAAATARFADLELYRLETFRSEDSQFGAVCLDLTEDTTYVIFRGTDESITGWREDFAISYTETGSQRMAVAYLDRILDEAGGKGRRKEREKRFIVGGHSKGGNLAVYAAMLLPEEKQAMIGEIYNFDGPGICPERFEPEGFARIRDKVRRYAPSYSVVGRLFEQDIPAVIVDSSAKGILQHDAKNWMVMNTRLVRTDVIPADCRLTNAVFKEWIDSADLEEREAFTKEFFDALETHNAETMAEFRRNGIRGVWNVIYSIATFSPPAKKAFNKLMKSASRNAVAAGTGKISATISWLADKAKQKLDIRSGAKADSMLFAQYPRLENGQVLLRKMTLQDVPALETFAQDERIYQMLPTFLYERKYEDKQKVISRMDRECLASGESVLLAVCLLPREEQMIGIAEIYNYEKEKGKASIGYRLMPQYWGKGIATQVVSLLKTYLLDTVGLRTITAHVMKENHGSAASLQKNGFRNLYPDIRENWGFGELTLTDKYVFKRAWLGNPEKWNQPVDVEQFVMAYRVEQDRIRAMLPEGFVSLRPVLRINSEIRDEETVYLELNTPVAKDGRKGWLNIGNWKSTRDDIQFARSGKTVRITAPFLSLSYTLAGQKGGCPAEKDNEGCFYIRNGEEEFRPAEVISAEKEYCFCAFAWQFRRKDAVGASSGNMLPAHPTEIRKRYRKCALTAKNAAAVPCEEVLGSYVVQFERKKG